MIPTAEIEQALVSATKEGFSFEFVNEARKYFDNFHYRRAAKMVAGVKINIQ